MLNNVEGKFFSVEEYKEHVKEKQTDKYDKIVLLYTNDPQGHDIYVKAAQAEGLDVLVMDNVIDNHFMQQLEYKSGGITFVRVDSDTVDNLVQKDEEKESVLSEEQQNTVKEVFEQTVKEQGGTVVLKPLSPEGHPVLITRPEFMRRMKEMQALQGMQFGELPDSYNVVVNSNHPLVANKLAEEKDEGKQKEIAQYLYELALLNQGMLKGENLTKFINTSLGFLK